MYHSCTLLFYFCTRLFWIPWWTCISTKNHDMNHIANHEINFICKLKTYISYTIIYPYTYHVPIYGCSHARSYRNLRSYKKNKSKTKFTKWENDCLFHYFTRFEGLAYFLIWAIRKATFFKETPKSGILLEWLW